jgi:predicted DNA-binding protein (UPF0251 family)
MPEIVESAGATVLIGEENQRVLAAIRALPGRQREALVLRFYLDLSRDETARVMGISTRTVKSATSRAVAALGRMLKEDSGTQERTVAAMRAIGDTVTGAPPLRLPARAAAAEPSHCPVQCSLIWTNKGFSKI